MKLMSAERFRWEKRFWLVICIPVAIWLKESVLYRGAGQQLRPLYLAGCGRGSRRGSSRGVVSADPVNDEDDDKLLNLLTELTGGMVTGFIVVAEFTDTDGDGRVYGNTLRNQKAHTSLGLLAYGDAIERERCVRTHFDDEDE